MTKSYLDHIIIITFITVVWKLYLLDQAGWFIM